jgi:hypothetical protein
MKITPTNGRVMWFFPGSMAEPTMAYAGQPLTAHVCHVHSDHMVNVDVIDANGVHHFRSSVPIVQDESPFTRGASPWLEWMPYQVGQAKKHAAA